MRDIETIDSEIADPTKSADVADSESEQTTHVRLIFRGRRNLWLVQMDIC